MRFIRRTPARLAASVVLVVSIHRQRTWRAWRGRRGPRRRTLVRIHDPRRRFSYGDHPLAPPVPTASGAAPRVTTTYDASAIQALSGLQHVRQRPLMYLGSAGVGSGGLHHLIWEIVDNSVDEAMAGNGDRIIVTLHPDGSVSVQDFGRGIPVDPMADGPHKGRSALEVV
ncbi:MAG: hypothetical protein KDB17_05225, partial [Ilumatobacter sp.]|nr:hypothetical protein [Ilumatobacter sp.]